jgi:hypothetical protein
MGLYSYSPMFVWDNLVSCLHMGDRVAALVTQLAMGHSVHNPFSHEWTRFWRFLPYEPRSSSFRVFLFFTFS